MARLYSNENFPLPAVDELRRLGHDVLTTQESGRAALAISDSEVLRFATGERRALLTLNRKHFVRLHHADSNHAGIIVCTLDLNYVRLAAHIHAAIAAYPVLDGQLIRINRGS